METEVLNVEIREGRGKRQSRRLRAEGHTPAILYGHKQDNVALTLKSDELNAALRHGARLVDLAGAVKESAFLNDIQWDPFGNEILHVDLTRVDKDEEVEVNVAVELRGVAPGVNAGGVVDHARHEVTIACKASEIPEKISVSINDLQLGATITASQLELPASGRVVGDDDMVIVACVEPTETPDEEAPVDMGAEPEVIGRKDESEDDDS